MKNYVLAVAMLFLAVGAMAQDAMEDVPQGTITIKPAIGGSLTNFSKSPSGDQVKSRPGLQVGGSIVIGNRLYIEPGVFYMRKSTKIADNNTPAADVKLTLGGIYVPVAVGFNVLGDENSFASVHALAGVSGFFLTDVTNGHKDLYRTPTYGTFVGAGVNVGLFFAEAKYEWSLTNVQTGDVSNLSIGKSRSLFLNVGLRFRM
jgi:Outer membrane protein beta-barrel domain